MVVAKSSGATCQAWLLQARERTNWQSSRLPRTEYAANSSTKQEMALKPSSCLMCGRYSSLDRRVAHAFTNSVWHCSLNSNSSTNVGSPKKSGSINWFTPDLSTSSIPHAKKTSSPSSSWDVGNSLLRIVMDFCNGWSDLRNCSASLVGSILVA